MVLVLNFSCRTTAAILMLMGHARENIPLSRLSERSGNVYSPALVCQVQVAVVKRVTSVVGPTAVAFAIAAAVIFHEGLKQHSFPAYSASRPGAIMLLIPREAVFSPLSLMLKEAFCNASSSPALPACSSAVIFAIPFVISHPSTPRSGTSVLLIEVLRDGAFSTTHGGEGLAAELLLVLWYTINSRWRWYVYMVFASLSIHHACPCWNAQSWAALRLSTLFV